jgi:4-hydroxybenzoate polyprenyltransferase
MWRGGKMALLGAKVFRAGFNYIGNATFNFPALRVGRDRIAANSDMPLKSAPKMATNIVSRMIPLGPTRIKSLGKALRIQQWATNLLVFVPLLLAHSFRPALVLNALAAFFCFCTIASSSSILIDLLDLESNGLHLKERSRTVVAGDMSVQAGLAISGLLAALSFAVAAHLPRRFPSFVLFYLIVTLAYSLKLQRVVLVDVITLSGLYTVRMVAGSVATHISISPWLAAFSTFFFLNLAMVKRFTELQNLHERDAHPTKATGYLLNDIEQVRGFGTASAYASIVIFALYINGHDVSALYHHPARMWLMMPFLILWVSRVWLLASRGTLHEDPAVFALTDRMSLLLGLAMGLIAWAAL